MKTTYVVKAPIYRYNTGNADNGYFKHSKEFDAIEDAERYASKCDSLFYSHELDKFDDEYYKLEEEICNGDFHFTGRAFIYRREIKDTIIGH